MNYYFSIFVNASFENVITKTTEELKKEGFGIITEIDMQGKLKEKLNIDFKKYKILGACNPSFAYQALQAEDKIGTMLPCNVLIIEQGENLIEVAAVNPIASMQAVTNSELADIAQEVTKKIKNGSYK